jgi:predicted KAP-like P-loop ATPase
MSPFDFSADKPVAAQPEDYFQRYEFARRIARVLAERRDSTSITLGVYGAWGEGKTSVMNFIAQELAAQSDTIVVPFNPWRFSDEQSLLLAFFTSLADFYICAVHGRAQGNSHLGRGRCRLRAG